MSQIFFIPDFHVVGIGFNALNKSRDDLHQIYGALGFLPLTDKKITLNDEKVKYFAANQDVLGDYVDSIITDIDEKCHAGDFLFMDFPFAIKFAGYSKIVSYSKTKGVKVIFFIHDLDGLRFANPLLNFSDSSCLDMAYCLISASPAMDKVLFNTLRVSKTVRIVDYNYWDYLTPEVCNRHWDALLCFAGNLAKSPFLSDIPETLIASGFNLYGKGMQEDYLGDYKGQYAPERLVSVLDGKFGLVWDGKTSTTCSGAVGRYLRINTSHKFALYMAAGKPVIVWKEGTLASIVAREKIGFAVSSLAEIPLLLSSMSGYQYLAMRKEVLRLQKDIITGKHLSRVIQSAMED
jgi:hypothetical protein